MPASQAASSTNGETIVDLRLPSNQSRSTQEARCWSLLLARQVTVAVNQNPHVLAANRNARVHLDRRRFIVERWLWDEIPTHVRLKNHATRRTAILEKTQLAASVDVLTGQRFYHAGREAVRDLRRFAGAREASRSDGRGRRADALRVTTRVHAQP